jgi:hypothetical protein
MMMFETLKDLVVVTCDSSGLESPWTVASNNSLAKYNAIKELTEHGMFLVLEDDGRNNIKAVVL